MSSSTHSPSITGSVRQSVVAGAEGKRLRRIRFWLLIVICGLVVSGLTAIPLVWGIELLVRLFGAGTPLGNVWPAMADWLAVLDRGIHETAVGAPMMFYGTDWLAFAHVVIAIAMIGPYRDPARNIWVIEFGLIACALVIPTALIFGPLRGIPFFWQLIDCSFGVVGAIPLWLAWRDAKALERADSRYGAA